MIPESPNRNGQILNIVAVTSVTIVLGLSLLGNYGPSLMTNDKCFSWLGCNIGFFGYDALIHFISGTMDVALIIWLMTKFPSFSLFHNRFWKNLLTVVALVALIAVLWEILEFSHDYFRMNILHENLTTPNTLDQPSNTDTMGDMTLSLLSATTTASLLGSFMKKKEEL